MMTPSGRGHGTAPDLDPGPVPAVVEPATPAPTTIPVTPRTHIEVTPHGDCARLTLVSVAADARLAVDLPPQAVDALVWALVAATPPPLLLAPPAPWEVARG